MSTTLSKLHIISETNKNVYNQGIALLFTRSLTYTSPDKSVYRYITEKQKRAGEGQEAGRKGILGGDEYVHNLECGDNYIGLYICQTLSNRVL